MSFPGEQTMPYPVRDGPFVMAAEQWVDDQSAIHALQQTAEPPVISVLTPVFNARPTDLQAAIDSVVAQTYPGWELCLVNDGSTDAGVDDVLDEAEERDSRIRVLRLPHNTGIARATNSALDMATGELVGMLDHDDILFPNALAEVVSRFVLDPFVDAVYTDQCFVTADGHPGVPLLKPDWSPVLFCGVMYVGHFLATRRSLAIGVGGFDPAFDNVQDFEFMLRLSERTSRIVHVPKVLYGWRRVDSSVAARGDAKPLIAELQAKAVSAHLERLAVPAVARPNPRHTHRALFRPSPSLPHPMPLSSAAARSRLRLTAQSRRLRTPCRKRMSLLWMRHFSDEPRVTLLLTWYGQLLSPMSNSSHSSRAG